MIFLQNGKDCVKSNTSTYIYCIREFRANAFKSQQNTLEVCSKIIIINNIRSRTESDYIVFRNQNEPVYFITTIIVRS